MLYSEKLYISQSKLNDINRALNEAGQMGEDDTYVETVTFSNGYQMDIKCCGTQDDVAWTEAVLFNEHGVQISYTEPSDEYDGEWELEDNDGNQYHVDVVQKD